MSTQSQSFVCALCHESHPGLPTDSAFTLPDVVWALSLEERAARAKWDSDLCQMGENYFIRCLLPIPFTDQPGYYGWGVWVEVEWPVFRRHLDLYDKDATGEPEAQGALANALPTYGRTLGLPVRIQFQSSTSRPAVGFAEDQDHRLAREAREGMSDVRYHEILASRGIA
jgi:hypothetical protein